MPDGAEAYKNNNKRNKRSPWLLTRAEPLQQMCPPGPLLCLRLHVVPGAAVGRAAAAAAAGRRADLRCRCACEVVGERREVTAARVVAARAILRAAAAPLEPLGLRGELGAGDVT
jgi:hypothetical protein